MDILLTWPAAHRKHCSPVAAAYRSSRSHPVPGTDRIDRSGGRYREEGMKGGLFPPPQQTSVKHENEGPMTSLTFTPLTKTAGY